MTFQGLREAFARGDRLTQPIGKASQCLSGVLTARLRRHLGGESGDDDFACVGDSSISELWHWTGACRGYVDDIQKPSAPDVVRMQYYSKSTSRRRYVADRLRQRLWTPVGHASGENRTCRAAN